MPSLVEDKLKLGSLPGIVAASVVFIAAILVAWRAAPDAGFVLDDYPVIVDREARIVGLKGWDWVIESDRPVSALTFALDGQLYGMDPQGWHWSNILIHILVTLAFFELVRRTAFLCLGRERHDEAAGSLALVVGFIAALLWSVHPLHTETVTYVVQRSEGLAALFLFLGLLSVVIWRQFGHPIWMALVVFVFGSLAILSKANAACFPILVLLLDFGILRHSKIGARSARWPIHCGAWLVLLVLVLTPAGFFLRSDSGEPSGAGVGFGVTSQTPWTYALAQMEAWIVYLGLIFWPSELLIDRPDEPGAISWKLLPGFLFLLCGIGIGLLAFKQARWWGAVLLMFFAALLPSSSVVPVKDIVVEHRLYLPTAAIAVLVSGAIIGLASLLITSRRFSFTAVTVGASILVFTLAVAEIWRTHVRNLDYVEGDALWIQILDADSSSELAQVNLGAVLLSQNKPDEAYALMQDVIAVNGMNAVAHMNAALALIQMEQPIAALEHLRMAERTRPNDTTVHSAMGDVHRELGNTQQAMYHYTMVVERSPQDVQTMLALANMLIEEGDLEEAVGFQDQAIQAARDLDNDQLLHSSLFNRANSAFQLREWAEAADYYRESVDYTEDADRQDLVLHWYGVAQERAAQSGEENSLYE